MGNKKNKSDDQMTREPKNLTLVDSFIQVMVTTSNKIQLPLIISHCLIIIKYGFAVKYLVDPPGRVYSKGTTALGFIYSLSDFLHDYYYFSDLSIMFRRYAYLITMLYLLILIIWYWIIIKQYQSQRKKSRPQTIKQFINGLTSWKNIVQITLSYLEEIVGQALYLKLFQLSFQSFTQSTIDLQSEHIYLANSFSSLLTSILLFLYTFFRFLVTGGGFFNFKNRNKSINLSGLQLTKVLLFFLLIIKNELLSFSLINFYMNVIIYLLICMMSIVNHFHWLHQVQQNLVLTELKMIAITSSYALAKLFICIKDSRSLESLPILTLMGYFLSSILLKRMWSIFIQQIILQYNSTKKQQQHPKYSQYQVSLFQFFARENHIQFKFVQSAFLSSHRKICKRRSCQCNDYLTQDRINDILAIDFVRLLNQQLKEYHRYSITNSYLINYVQIMNYYGFANQAFQQAKRMLSRSKGKKNEQSEQINELLNLQNSTFSSSITSENNKNKSIITVEGHLHKFEYIRNRRKLNRIDQNKVILLIDDIKDTINSNFIQNTIGNHEENSDLVHSVQLFLASEQSNHSIQQKVMKNFKRKIAFLQFLSTSVEISATKLFAKCKVLMRQIRRLESRLDLLYQQFPSQKIQSVNSFYQSELMNNFFSAFKLANITTISDEKLLKMNQAMSINLFANNVNYLTLKMEGPKNNFTIVHKSNQIHDFFGYSFKQFKDIITLNPLIPKGIRKGHGSQVLKFMQDGNSKFFRQIVTNLVETGDEFVKPVDFFFDINFSDFNDMNFVTFFLNQSNSNSYLVVNGSNQIQSMSQNFFNMIGIDNSNIDLKAYFIKRQILPIKNVSIISLFPDFTRLITQLNASNNEQNGIFYKRFYNQQMNFLNKKSFFEYQLKRGQVDENSGRFSYLWGSQQNLDEFITNFSIYYKDLQGIHSYYIFEIQEIKNIKSSNEIVKPTIEIRINSKIVVPETHLGDLQHNQDVNQSFQDCELGDTETEQKVAKISDHRKYFNKASTFGEKNYDEEFIRKKMLNLKQNKFNEVTEVEEDSKSNYKPLINSVNFQSSVDQQRFFSEAQEQEQSVDEPSAPKQQGLKQNHQEMRNYVMMQLQVEKEDQKIVQVDDAASQVSSLAGIRKSKFFRKYEIIDKILKSKVRPLQLSLSVMVYVLKFILVIIFLSLVLSNVSSDLRRFLQEIDMLQIKVNILGPVQKFFLSQNAWVGYWVNAWYFKNIPLEEGSRLSQLSVYSIYDTYAGLKIDFNQQLSNPYLEEFFTNQNITIREKTVTGMESRTMSFRESLIKWVTFMYDFTALINWRQFNISVDSSQPFLFYSNANILVYIARFNQLVGQILQYTLNRTEVVGDKWLITTIPFIIMTFFTTLLSFIFFRGYIRNYERVLQMFRTIEADALQKDLTRYTIIQEILQKDANLMFKYKFDIEQKEKYLELEDIKKSAFSSRSQKREKFEKSTIKYKLPWYLQALTFGISYIIFLVNALTVFFLTKNYLQAYKPTASFYKEMADVSVAVCGIYAKREMHYYYQYYFYFNQTDGQTLLTEIQNDLQEIQKFSDSLAQFPQISDFYLISESFKLDMIYYSTNDICGMLSSVNNLKICQGILRIRFGVARKGLVPTLNYIYNSIFLEGMSTNFTNRSLVYYPVKIFELPLITAQVFLQLMSQFRNGLQLQTQNLINNINIICIVFLLVNMVQILLIVINVRRYYEKEYLIVKGFLLLLPQQTIFLESAFERALRQLILLEHLY